MTFTETEQVNARAVARLLSEPGHRFMTRREVEFEMKRRGSTFHAGRHGLRWLNQNKLVSESPFSHRFSLTEAGEKFVKFDALGLVLIGGEG